MRVCVCYLQLIGTQAQTGEQMLDGEPLAVQHGEPQLRHGLGLEHCTRLVLQAADRVATHARHM